MVNVEYSPKFSRFARKMKDEAMKEKLKGQVKKLLENPEIGKPMRYARKGTRELYVAPFRLSYTYLKEEGKVVLLGVYHKDKQ